MTSSDIWQCNGTVMKLLPLTCANPVYLERTANTAFSHWQARLQLGFSNDAGTTRLVERSHVGPLRVQKPLYPEGASVCHAIIVHPPGGVVGGDELDINVAVQTDAHALITTPGAAKWYRANGNESRQSVRIEVAAGAVLEWLPQETIFFNQAQVRLEHHVSLASDASYMSCEILCFGRTASGEVFDQGCVMQSTSIRRAGRLIWFEQGQLHGGSQSMNSPLSLAGASVCATFILCGTPLSPAALDEIRSLSGDSEQIGVTQLKHLAVIRYLGHSSENAKRLMMDAWRIVRAAMLAREARIPRIWNT